LLPGAFFSGFAPGGASPNRQAQGSEKEKDDAIVRAQRRTQELAVAKAAADQQKAAAEEDRAVTEAAKAKDLAAKAASARQSSGTCRAALVLAALVASR